MSLHKENWALHVVLSSLMSLNAYAPHVSYWVISFFVAKKQGMRWVVNALRLKVLGLLFGFRNVTNAAVRREYNSSLWLQFFVGSLQSWALGEYNSSLIDETSYLSHLSKGRVYNIIGNYVQNQIKQYSMYLFTEGVVYFVWHALLDVASQILNPDGRGSTTKSRQWC